MFDLTSRLSGSRRALRIASLSVGTAIGLACTGGLSILVGGELGFNPRMRADLGPLSPAQLEDDQRTFSDAQPDETGLISQLLPVEMTSNQLKRLRKADTFWTLGNRVDVSYELTVAEPRFAGEPLTYSIGPGQLEDSGEYANLIGWAAKQGFTDPITRRLAIFRGAHFAAPYPLAVDTNTVVLRTCVDGAPHDDPNAPSGRLDQGCSDMEVTTETCLTDNLIRNSTSFPFTVMRCGVTFLGDASMSLEVIDRASEQNIAQVQPILRHRAEALYPNLREVQTAAGGIRRLARPLSFDEEECEVSTALDPDGRPCTSLDEDPGDGRKVLKSQWSWQVAEDAGTGWWDENFSPQLIVTRVFLFVQDPKKPGEDGRQYLLPEGIRKLGIDKFDCPVHEDEETGRAVFEIALCDGNILVTPTYDHSDLVAEVTERLVWEAKFRVTAIGASFPSDLPVKRGDQLFIEFEVQGLDTAQSRSGLTLEPASYDFGDVEQGTRDTR